MVTVMPEAWPKFKPQPVDEDLLLQPPTVQEQLEADWKLLRGEDFSPPDELPRMTDAQLKDFIRGVLGNTIFTSEHIEMITEWSCACEGRRSRHQPSTAACLLCEHAFEHRDIPAIEWGLVFVPLMMGVLAEWPKEQLSKVGCLWAYNKDALPRGVNGYPMFMCVNFMHMADWAKAHKIIRRETERLQNLNMGDDD